MTLIPEEVEDLWQVYNLVLVGDRVKCSTYRKVVSQKSTAVFSEKKRVNLNLEITAIDFDPDDASIRISGRNVEENKHVKMGAFHTSVLELNRKFIIQKDCWDYVTLQRLKDACDPSKKAKLAAIVMQAGLAHVCLITNNLTLVRAKIEKSLPKKRNNFSRAAHSDAMNKFFKAVFDAFMKHIDLSVVKCVILASPGFTKDEFHAYILDQISRSTSSNASNTSESTNTSRKKKNGTKEVPVSSSSGISLANQYKLLAKNRSIFVLVHSSTGYKHALDEILQDEKLLKKIENVSAMTEVTTLKRFFELMSSKPDQAVYSLKHVSYALESNAVETLLISDSLFRSNNIKTRKLYVDLVEKCKEHSNVEVVIFSAMHVSGQQLDKMTGIAAILRYSLPDIDELISGTTFEQPDASTREQISEEVLDEQDLHPEIFF